ncbi:MAG: NADPH-dependent F420 reductase [Pseudobdellovibrionaceae bacterium]
MKVGVLGSGPVGEKLADGFLKFGYQVMRGSRSPEKLKSWKDKSGSSASIGTFEETAHFGEVIVLAVKGTAAESALEEAGLSKMSGKIVIDPTNPIADVPPVHGVLNYFTGPNESLLERLQKKAPQLSFVKAFNSIGNQFMVNPQFKNGPPTMFICGNDDRAKKLISEILTQFGWETEDMGTAEAARAIEPLCMLWCIPGIRGGSWNHAFKFLRA